MELKQISTSGENGIFKSFNRTFMELKQDKGGEPYYANKSFNRTFMELKQANARIVHFKNIVLIGPSWN